MQGQRNSVESIPEPLQFDLSSNSNSSGMDQPFYQSNMLLNSVETPTLADYLLSPNGTNMDFLNVVPHDTDGLSVWNSQNPNSSAYVANREHHDETKMDHAWNTALSISSGGSPRMKERHCERTSILPLKNVDLNLNNAPVDDGQATQGLISSHVSQHNARVFPYSDGVEVSMCPFMPEFFEPEHAPYSNSDGRSSNGVGQVSEDDGRAKSSVDGWRVACKRKNMEGVIGESSTSRNNSADLTIPSSSRYLPVASSIEENQNPSLIPLHRCVSSECYPSSSLSENAETSQRNLRVRLNSACQHHISLSQSNSSVSGSRLSSVWSPGEPSSALNPFVHPAGQSRPQILLPVPSLPHHVRHSPSSSRIGSSSTMAYQQWRLIASPEETSTRDLPRNDIADHSAFLSSTNVHHLVQDLPNWNPSNSSLSMAGNGASCSTVSIPLPGSIRAPSDMVPVQHPRNLSEVVRSSLFLSRGSASAHQINNLPSRHSGRSAATQDPGQTSRTVRLGHSPPNPRTSVSVERQRYGVSGLPLSARSGDGRSRMISEQIRNALDLMRRGVNLRFEDVFIFDQSGFYGRADLYDRHRDMRLDVDNMSYEELLALEERIGYVSTGLSEDAILKSLRQRKYLPCKLEVAFAEQEPCCICREDYIEGEDIGTLECKHDFHNACIKQWLMIKNLCPICKTTALVT